MSQKINRNFLLLLIAYVSFMTLFFFTISFIGFQFSYEQLESQLVTNLLLACVFSFLSTFVLFRTFLKFRICPILENGKKQISLFEEIKNRDFQIKEKNEIIALSLTRAGTGYFSYNVKKDFLFWDKLSLKTFGVYKDEFNNKFEDWAERVHKEDLEKTSDEFKYYLENKNINQFELNYRIIKKNDHEERHILVSGSIDRDSSGLPLQVNGLHFDVTEQKRKELELLNENKNQTHEKNINSEYISVLSHEIKTPMNAIIGMSSLALKSGLNNRQKRYVQTINETSLSLLNIVNDILDISKIDSNKMSVQNESFELKKLLHEVYESFNTQFFNKGLKYKLDVSDDLISFYIGDKEKIKQILKNLLSNAIKFTELGEIKLEVGVKNKAKNKDNIYFSLSDTGVGIGEEDIPFLFKPYSQIDSSLSRNYHGLGLGLAVSHKICNLLGGELHVKSKVDKGSTFTIEIPLSPQPYQTHENIEALIRKNTENLNGIRILLVEDNEVNQELVVDFLLDTGVEISVASSGEEALSLLEHDKFFHCVFMDIQMPGIDGFETTREIRKKFNSHELPVIALTANILIGDSSELKELEMNGHVSKPFDRDKLIDAIRKFGMDEEREIISTKNTNAAKIEEDLKDKKIVKESNVSEKLDLERELENLGVNFSKVNERFSGNFDLFYKLLLKMSYQVLDKRPLIDSLFDKISKPEFKEEFLKEIHGLKGVFANLGVACLAETLKSIELAIKDNHESEVNLRMAQFRKESFRFNEIITMYLVSDKSEKVSEEKVKRHA